MAFGIRPRGEARAIQSMPWGTWPGDEYGPTWSGANVDRTSAMQLLAVYGSVRMIADQIATMPLGVFRKVDGAPEALPVPPWLVQPKVGLSRIAWMTQILSSLLLDGNGYFGVKRGQEGALVELDVLDPDRCSPPDPGNGRPDMLVDGRKPPYDVVHIPALMLPGACKGLSPVEAARQSIGMGIASQEYGARFFGQDASPGGVIEYEQEVPSDRLKAIARTVRRRHSGKQNAHLPLVLEGGGKWKTTSVTNEQAQFLETRGYTAAEIAGQMFLLDPSDLGIPLQGGTNLTYANLEQRNLRRVQVTLLPWIIRLEDALSGLLPRPRYVKFNVAGLLRADLKTRYEAHEIGIRNRFLVVNEARELEELPPLEGGDVPYEPPVPVAVDMPQQQEDTNA